MAAGRAWRPSRGRAVIVVLLAIACGAALFLLWTPGRPVAERVDAASVAPPPAPADRPLAGTAPVPAPAPAAPAPQGEGDADPTRDLSSYVARGENPSMAQVIERLHQQGVHSGLGAFTPPGTSPPLVGLAVPEDFALPKGYVRHHQATDDGQRIEAILMFAPDFQLFDANNKPIEMPKNLVVPPELAPPGMPIRRIAIPAASDAARAGR
ncbi:hypothetical protein HF313_19825 [Massilia atriviolacea]|uniref:Uncharacterized protein n=1 Tax=Massilia atriviolacea TaxID=2495579 RepID=A0A430HSP6_9BURK|nr:hypothetical protein EJB06_04880 [Massilia atriviolacea]